MTKGQIKAKNRRALRRREKNSLVGFDKMIGACARRGYGQGVPTV